MFWISRVSFLFVFNLLIVFICLSINRPKSVHYFLNYDALQLFRFPLYFYKFSLASFLSLYFSLYNLFSTYFYLFSLFFFFFLFSPLFFSYPTSKGYSGTLAKYMRHNHVKSRNFVKVLKHKFPWKVP